MAAAMSEALLRRLNAPGPKRILALDGGGVRGVIALQALARVEALLRERHGRPDLVLADYFDLVGGTSTGSIIAAALALGREVAEVQEVYRTTGRRVFSRRRLRFWESLYDEKPLEEVLAAHFGDVALGDAALRTGLCVVTKRADTNSTWPLLNHPGGRFYAMNRRVRLRDAVRASVAAPVMFRPRRVEVAPGETGVFVDGAVSMANNPALLLLMVATFSGFPFRWPVGEDRLLLLSVGTGRWERTSDPMAVAKASTLGWLSRVPDMLIADAGTLTETLLQALGRSPTRRTIDLELGDLADDAWGGLRLVHYLRYDAPLDRQGLEALGLPDLAKRAEGLRSLGGAAAIPAQERVGAAAARAVSPDHFPPAFDLDARG
jgi:hypothetical protein